MGVARVKDAGLRGRVLPYFSEVDKRNGEQEMVSFPIICKYDTIHIRTTLSYLKLAPLH